MNIESMRKSVGGTRKAASSSMSDYSSAAEMEVAVEETTRRRARECESSEDDEQLGVVASKKSRRQEMRVVLQQSQMVADDDKAEEADEEEEEEEVENERSVCVEKEKEVVVSNVNGEGRGVTGKLKEMKEKLRMVNSLTRINTGVIILNCCQKVKNAQRTYRNMICLFTERMPPIKKS